MLFSTVGLRFLSMHLAADLHGLPLFLFDLRPERSIVIGSLYNVPIGDTFSGRNVMDYMYIDGFTPAKLEEAREYERAESVAYFGQAMFVLAIVVGAIFAAIYRKNAIESFFVAYGAVSLIWLWVLPMMTQVDDSFYEDYEQSQQAVKGQIRSRLDDVVFYNPLLGPLGVLTCNKYFALIGGLVLGICAAWALNEFAAIVSVMVCSVLVYELRARYRSV